MRYATGVQTWIRWLQILDCRPLAGQGANPLVCACVGDTVNPCTFVHALNCVPSIVVGPINNEVLGAAWLACV